MFRRKIKMTGDVVNALNKAVQQYFDSYLWGYQFGIETPSSETRGQKLLIATARATTKAYLKDALAQDFYKLMEGESRRKSPVYAKFLQDVVEDLGKLQMRVPTND